MSERPAEYNAPTLFVSGIKYPQPVGKRFERKAGLLEVTTLERSSPAVAYKKPFNSWRDYTSWREQLTQEFMPVAGQWKDNPGEEQVVVWGSGLIDNPNAWAATKEFLSHESIPTVLRIDVDRKGFNEAGGGEAGIVHQRDDAVPFATHRSLHTALCTVAPWLNGIASLIYDSSSAEIYDADSDVLLSQKHGLRCELLIDDGAAIPTLIDILHKRCWLNRFGWSFVGLGGVIYPRSLVDESLAVPTQPDYACCGLGAGLVSKREFTVSDGGTLITSTVPAMTVSEERFVMAEQQRVAEPLLTISRSIKQKRRATKGATLKAAGATTAEVTRTLTAFDKQILLEKETVVFEGNHAVAVLELLNDGAAYDGRRCLDPLEPEYSNRRLVAKFYWNEGGAPKIHSYAHGSRAYGLAFDKKSQLARLTEIDPIGTPSDLIRIIALGYSSPGHSNTDDSALYALGKRTQPKSTKDALKKDVSAFRKHNSGKQADDREDITVFLERYRLIQSTNTVVDLAATITAINRFIKYQHFKNAHQHLLFDDPPKTWFQYWQQCVEVLSGVRYDPGKPLTWTDQASGEKIVNLYLPPKHPPAKDIPQWFIDHTHFVLPENDDAEHFLQWLANKVQNPESRSYGVLMYAQGVFGTGRSVFAPILQNVLQAGVVPKSFEDISGEGKQAHWNDWIETAQIVCVDEVKQEGSSFRHDTGVYEALKDKIDIATYDRDIKTKFESSHSAKQYANFLLMSNHKNAIRIPKGDRRFWVARNVTKVHPDGEKYYAELFARIKDPQAMADVYHYLNTLEITKGMIFPPMTAAKAEMYEAGLTKPEELYEEACSILHPIAAQQQVVKCAEYISERDDDDPDDFKRFKGVIQRLFSDRTRAVPGADNRGRIRMPQERGQQRREFTSCGITRDFDRCLELANQENPELVRAMLETNQQAILNYQTWSEFVKKTDNVDPNANPNANPKGSTLTPLGVELGDF